MKINALIVLFMLCISFVGCTKRGCTDPDAINYDESAKKDDGSCIYEPASEGNLLVGRYKCTRKSGYGQVEGRRQCQVEPQQWRCLLEAVNAELCGCHEVV